MAKASKKSVSFIKGVRDRLKNVEDGINREKYEALEDAFAYAREIYDDEEAFAEFAAEEFFAERKKALKRDDTLRLVMVFLLGSHTGPRYDRACTYARALQPSFQSEIEPDTIADFIEESGGIETLYRDVIAREKYEGLGLHIEATAEQLDEVLAADPDGECVIRIKRVEDGKGGWVRFELMSFQMEV